MQGSRLSVTGFWSRTGQSRATCKLSTFLKMIRFLLLISRYRSIPVYTKACSTVTLARGSSVVVRKVGRTQVSFRLFPLMERAPLTFADRHNLPPIKLTRALFPEPKGPTTAKADLGSFHLLSLASKEQSTIGPQGEIDGAS